MDEATGDTVMAAPREGTPQAGTSLLSLPVELLIKIISELAPSGGAKAGTARLVSRLFDELACPITLSAISLPEGLKPQVKLLAVLANPNSTVHSHIRSIRVHAAPLAPLAKPPRYNPPPPQAPSTLPLAAWGPFFLHSRHLHTITVTGPSPSRPVPAWVNRADIITPSVRTLILRNLDLRGTPELRRWAPQVQHVQLVQCIGSDALFHGADFWIAFYSCIRTARHLELSCLGPLDEEEVHLDQIDFAMIPLQSFALHHTAMLFTEDADSVGAAAQLVGLLNRLGRAVDHLVLPFENAPIVISAAYGQLSMPKLTHLVLESESGRPGAMVSPRWEDSNTADQLATFLSAMSFPALRSLEFRDWVDRASLNDNLSLLLVFLYDLLSSLKLPHLTRIEWSNSESTAAGEPSMVYERQNGTAKWNLRKWLSE